MRFLAIGGQTGYHDGIPGVGAVKQDFFQKKILEDVEKVLKRFTSSRSQNQTPDAPDLAAPVSRDIASGFAIYAGVDCHHQCWHPGPTSRRKSAYEVVAMRSSIWRRSEMGIIVSFDTPTAEHFFVTCIASAN